MRRIALLLAIVFVVAACGDDDTSTTTTPSTAATTSTTAASGTSEATTATTAAPSDDGPTDCLEIWSEATVQGIAGEQFTFFQANADRSACTYTALPDSIALAWRTGDRANFEASKAGAGVTAEVMEIEVCDAAYFVEIQGAILIMEGFSESQGRVYTTTVSGLDEPTIWSVALLEHVC